MSKKCVTARPDPILLKNVSYLSDLVRELQDNPDLALVFGLHPLRLPYVENFSAFLGDTENSIFQKARDSLVSKLIELREIKGTYLTFDSPNIPAKVKENNLILKRSGRTSLQSLDASPVYQRYRLFCLYSGT